MSTAAIIQSAEQLKQRVEDDDKEYKRLMKFELKFDLVKPQFAFKTDTDPAVSQCYLQLYTYDNKKAQFIRTSDQQTDAITFTASMELTIQGKVSFIKSLAGEFNVGLVQSYKVIINLIQFLFFAGCHFTGFTQQCARS